MGMVEALVLTTSVAVPIEPQSKWTPVNPAVFCVGYGPSIEIDDSDQISPHMVRWGGNTASRFNFDVGNIWNAGADWHYANVSRGGKRLFHDWLAHHVRASHRIFMTVPILGWVAKDSTSRGSSRTPNPHTTSVPLQDSSVASLVELVRQAQPDWERMYALDNEPFLWHKTHGDAVKNRISPEEFAKQWLHYARLVRGKDPDAVLTGPGLWGWEDLANLDPFLRMVMPERDQRGRPLLNVVSSSLYPQNTELLADLDDVTARNTPKKTKKSGALDHLRVLTVANFDDENFVDPSWINKPVVMIPEIRRRIDAIAVSLQQSETPQVGIVEYNWGGQWTSAGAIAQSLILIKGIKLSLHHLCSYTWPPPNSPSGRAFKALSEDIIGSDRQRHLTSFLPNQRTTDPWLWVRVKDIGLRLYYISTDRSLVKIANSSQTSITGIVIEKLSLENGKWEKMAETTHNEFQSGEYEIYRISEMKK